MANLTKQQLLAAGAMIAGTHDRLDTKPRIDPGYNIADIYRGIYPAAGDSLRPPPLDNRTAGGGAWWDSKNQFDPRMTGRGLPMIPGPDSPIKSDERLAAGTPLTAQAYGEDSPTAPGQDAIAEALRGPGSAWTGGWGSQGFKPFLSGDPGQVDWSVANPGMGGINGPVDQRQYGAPNGSPMVAPQRRAPMVAPRRKYGSTFNDVPRRPSPEIRARLRAQQSADQRGQAALRASGMLDEFGMIT